MEFAIPILAIGGWFVSCERKPNTKPKTEAFSNLRNDDCGISNYEKTNYNKQIKNSTNASMYYESGVPIVKKDINPNTQFTSLTGDVMSSNSVNHNNMVPFFGSKSRGHYFNSERSNDSILDSMQGSGSE